MGHRLAEAASWHQGRCHCRTAVRQAGEQVKTRLFHFAKRAHACIHTVPLCSCNRWLSSTGSPSPAHRATRSNWQPEKRVGPEGGHQPWTGRGRSRSRGGTPCTQCCQSRCRCGRLQEGGPGAASPTHASRGIAQLSGCQAATPQAGCWPLFPPPVRPAMQACATRCGTGCARHKSCQLQVLLQHAPVMPMITELSTYTG